MKKRKAFTLIELLGVIVAIAILAVMILPFFTKKSPERVQVGDLVVIDGLNITGKVDTLYFSDADVVFLSSKGILSRETVNTKNLRVVQKLEETE